MKTCCLIFLTAFPFAISAQSVDSTKTELLKEVVVSSQRIAEKNLKTAASISVLSVNIFKITKLEPRQRH